MVKIKRANEHIRYLNILSRRFFNRNQHTVSIERNKKLGRGGFVVSVRPTEVPLKWSAIVSDAIHNLRSPLDILWRTAIHGTSPTARKAYFPLYESAHQFESKMSGVPQNPLVKKAMELVKAIKPYKGGNDLLWNLGAIDDRNKHEVLALVGCAYSYRLASDGSLILLSPMEDGTVMSQYGGSVPTDMDMQGQLVFEVTFGQGEILEGEPVLPTLHQMAKAVDGVVEAFTAAGLLA